MNDLLGSSAVLDFRTAENCGGSTKQDRVPQFSPFPPPEGGGKERELWNRGVTAGLAPQNRGDLRNSTSWLRQRRDQLNAELGQCAAALTAAEDAAEPWENAYWDAFRRLSQLTGPWREYLPNVCAAWQCPHDYDTVLWPAYEALRLASADAHPFKQRVQDMKLWQAAILKQLREVEKEIDRPKSPQFSRSRTAENCGELLL